jgi:hypothetical protein
MVETDLSMQDKRTVERCIRNGLVDEKSWDRHLKGLPDVTEKGTPVTVVLELMDEDLEAGGDDAAQ